MIWLQTANVSNITKILKLYLKNREIIAFEKGKFLIKIKQINI